MSRSVKFLYLQQEDVIECGGLDMPQIIAAVEQVYALHEQGECIEPEAPLITWDGPQSKRVLAHPAWVGGEVSMAGIKWIPSNPENPRKRGMPRASAIIILNDDDTGYPLAVMDGTIVSAARTGAGACCDPDSSVSGEDAASGCRPDGTRCLNSAGFGHSFPVGL